MTSVDIFSTDTFSFRYVVMAVSRILLDAERRLAMVVFHRDVTPVLEVFFLSTVPVIPHHELLDLLLLLLLPCSGMETGGAVVDLS